MKTLMVGHRGVKGECPENTEVSIVKAAELGIKWVEVDIQPSKDGVLVVCHDHTVDRCSDHSGRVDSFTLEELKSFDFGSWFSPEFKGERILTLSELLVIAERYQLSLNLEVKLDTDKHQYVVTSLANALAESRISDERILLSSFSKAVVLELSKQLPQYARGLITEKLTDGDMELLQTVNAFSCHLNYKNVQQKDIEQLRAKGYQIWCYTVNQPDGFPLMNEVDAIFTDYPARF